MAYIVQLSYLAGVKRATLFLLLFGLGLGAKAQTSKSVWDSPKQRVSDKGSSVKKKFDTYKKHLEAWGVDTSYSRAFSIGGRLRSDGWSGGLLCERKSKGGTRHQYSLFFSEIKHDKQIKQKGENKAFPQLGQATPFVFGKINNLYLLQLGYNREKMLLPGILEGNMSLGFRYGGGFSVAMLKPYYLKLIYVEYTPEQVASLKEERYNAGNDSIFINRNSILGAADWSKGLDEIRCIPGAYIEGAFTIQPAKYKMGMIQTITLGAQLSIHSQALPVMAGLNANNWQGCLFAGLELGKRW